MEMATADGGDDDDVREIVLSIDAPAGPRPQEVARMPVHAEAGETPELDTVLSPPQDAPDRAPRAPLVATDWVVAPAVDVAAIDIAQMQRRILQKTRELEPEPLRAWLVTQPELWSLQYKPQIGTGLQRHLLEQGDAISTDHYDVLATFFDWNEALDAPDPYYVVHARRQMHLRWLLQPAGHHELSKALHMRGDSAASVPHVRKLLALLGPASYEDTGMLAMLWPGRPTRVRRLLDLIGFIPDGRKPPPPMDRERATSWYLAGERHMFNPIAAMLGLMRSLVVGATFLLLCLLLAMIDNNPAPGISPVLKVGLYGAAAVVGMWVTWYGCTSLLRWQSRAETDPQVTHPQLHRWFIPAVGTVPAVLILADQHDAAAILALPLLMTTLLRWARHEGKRLGFRWSWGWVWAVVFGLKAALVFIGFLIAYPQAALAATAIAWTADLVAQRRKRRTAST
ncbi:hypothetical protein [Xanthomonas oryzae]|uniref:hypothetical protein n=1 Tax=Xanthomonas oryzae TaxID=347 RepID=UPI001034D5C6|nr:hypothetical protein [Xanthomonas oryzae]QBH05487.1 hypothetical protein EYC57_22050 [Xanthomonas oryzae]